jgi:hypothetical protein
MNKDRVLKLLLICFFSFLGGVVSQPLMRAGVSLAQGESPDRVFFRDQNGRTRLDLGVVNGQPLQNLYGDDGRLRMQFGTYSEEVSANEKGMPFITFSGNNGHLKMLLRVAGPNESPVLVMKDNRGNDRIVLGLSLGDPGEEPFLATFDKDGAKRMIFGEY